MTFSPQVKRDLDDDIPYEYQGSNLLENITAHWNGYNLQTHSPSDCLTARKLEHVRFVMFIFRFAQASDYCGRECDVAAQILPVLLHQMSRDPAFPTGLRLLSNALNAVMQVVIRVTAPNVKSADLEEFQKIVHVAIAEIELHSPGALKRMPKIHRLLHIVDSIRRFGSLDETNGSVSYMLCSSLS